MRRSNFDCLDKGSSLSLLKSGLAIGGNNVDQARKNVGMAPFYIPSKKSQHVLNRQKLSRHITPQLFFGYEDA